MNLVKTFAVLLALGVFCGTAWADMSPGNFRPMTPPPGALPGAVQWPLNAPVPLPGGYYTADYVDIGNPASEPWHLSGAPRVLNPGVPAADWGVIEGQGVRGGYGAEPDLRVIWGDGDTGLIGGGVPGWHHGGGPGGMWADIDMDFGQDVGVDKYLAVRWLDGFAVAGGGADSFDIYLNGALVATVLNGGPNPEQWWDMGVWNMGQPVGVNLVTVQATFLPAWGSWPAWGEVGFSEMGTYTIPAPGAALLGAIGLGLVAWVRRRSA